jgi:hypothetical protein
VWDPRAGAGDGRGIVEEAEVREHAVHPPIGRIPILRSREPLRVIDLGRATRDRARGRRRRRPVAIA